MNDDVRQIRKLRILKPDKPVFAENYSNVQRSNFAAQRPRGTLQISASQPGGA